MEDQNALNAKYIKIERQSSHYSPEVIPFIADAQTMALQKRMPSPRSFVLCVFDLDNAKAIDRATNKNLDYLPYSSLKHMPMITAILGSENHPEIQDPKHPCIAIDKQLLRQLTPSDQKALVAHEMAHFFLGHHWNVTRTNCCMFPLTGPTQAIDRQADRMAADLCGNADDVISMLIKVQKFIIDRHIEEEKSKKSDVSLETRIAARIRADLQHNRFYPHLFSRAYTLETHARDVMQKPLKQETLDALRDFKLEMRQKPRVVER